MPTAREQPRDSRLPEAGAFGCYRLIRDAEDQPLVAEHTQSEKVLLGYDQRWQRLVEIHLVADSHSMDGRSAMAFFERARAAADHRGHGFPRIVDFGRCQGWLFWICQLTDGERFADFVHRRGRVEPMLLVILADRVVRLLARLRHCPELYQRVDLQGLMLVSWQDAYAVPRLWRPGITAPSGWSPPPAGHDPVTYQLAHWLAFLASGRYWQPEDWQPSGPGRSMNIPDLPPALRSLWRRTMDQQHGGAVPTLDDWARELSGAARGLMRRAGLKQIDDPLPIEKLGLEEPVIQSWLLPGEPDLEEITEGHLVPAKGRRPGIAWHALRAASPETGAESLLQRVPPPSVVKGLDHEACFVANLGPLPDVKVPAAEEQAEEDGEPDLGPGADRSRARRKPVVVGGFHASSQGGRGLGGGEPAGPSSVPPIPSGQPPLLKVENVWQSGEGMLIEETPHPGLPLSRILAARKRLRLEEVIPILDRLKQAFDLVMKTVPWSPRVRPTDIFLHVCGDPPGRTRQELVERHFDAWPEFDVHLRLHLTMGSMLDSGLVPTAAPFVSAEERHRVEWLQLVAVMLGGLEPADVLNDLLDRLPSDVRNWMRVLELGGPAPDVEDLIDSLKRPGAVEPLQVIGRAG